MADLMREKIPLVRCLSVCLQSSMVVFFLIGVVNKCYQLWFRISSSRFTQPML